MTSPCYDCKQRTVGCHSKCDLYKEFTQELERVKQVRLRYYAENRTTLKAKNRNTTLVERQAKHNKQNGRI